MANRMLARLQAKDKAGIFKRTQTAVSYPTRFAPFDYRNGYMVQVRDLEDNVITQYPSTGIVGGSFNTVVGRSGTAKTTFTIQAASNIVRPFENSFVIHYDLEQATTYTRIKNVTGLPQREMDDKYVLKQERSYIEDIMEAVMSIAREKEENRNDYMYDTGLKDEFNIPIRSFVPTVIILDSIPTATYKPKDENDIELEGGTYANRVAKSLAQFYKRLTPIIKEYNIIVFAINHINAKIEINPMVKTQAQVNYLKQDESLPGGNAPIYYAHNLLKFVSSGKKSLDKDGYDGFGVRVELIKSRTNKAGQSVNMCYNQEFGFDPVMTQYDFASEHGLINGARKDKRWLTGYEDLIFDSRKFRREFIDRPELRMALYDATLPFMEDMLSKVNPDETEASMNNEDVIKRLGLRIDNVVEEDKKAG